MNQNFQQPGEALWKKLKHSDAAAFEHLYRMYAADLFNYGSKLTSDANLLKDSIQDIFIEIWKYRETIGIAKHPKFYLFKTLRHRILRNSNAVPLFLDNYSNPAIFEYPCHETPEHLAIQLEQNNLNTKIIQDLLSKLSSRQREAIHLHFYHNFSYVEMTALMGMNYQSILNLMQRALKTLRQEAVKFPAISFLVLIGLIAFFA
ncbi:sigma-70 family RNA polymerase sigma factor [Danxiaibacter flavus]|uniref:Sigma-70 family RNA polymerase sigma factor n=1 Tax=Danxiaibacter flavus TaxID=3049108 RepID=A0ABV3ZPF1_9BACT|nr:sigma-70 family RNA polymerase sigma factor [Chitinophagaceae bacterium DXS]